MVADGRGGIAQAIHHLLDNYPRKPEHWAQVAFGVEEQGNPPLFHASEQKGGFVASVDSELPPRNVRVSWNGKELATAADFETLLSEIGQVDAAFSPQDQHMVQVADKTIGIVTGQKAVDEYYKLLCNDKFAELTIMSLAAIHSSSDVLKRRTKPLRSCAVALFEYRPQSGKRAGDYRARYGLQGYTHEFLTCLGEAADEAAEDFQVAKDVGRIDGDLMLARFRFMIPYWYVLAVSADSHILAHGTFGFDTPYSKKLPYGHAVTFVQTAQDEEGRNHLAAQIAHTRQFIERMHATL